MSLHINNISTKEIKKFTQFAQDWWDKNGTMKSLHDINPLRLNYVTDCTSLSGKKVLDVGCGGGLLAEKIAEQGAIVSGIDHSELMIDVAQRHAQQSGLDIRYNAITIEQLVDTTEETFDLIICMELLEHVPHFESIVFACKKHLKHGGLIIFSTINRNAMAFLLAIIGAEYLLRLLPRGTHYYQSLVKPKELRDVCEKAGLRLNNFRGFSYNPFTRRYYFCDNTWVNYLACFNN